MALKLEVEIDLTDDTVQNCVNCSNVIQQGEERHGMVAYESCGCVISSSNPFPLSLLLTISLRFPVTIAPPHHGLHTALPTSISDYRYQERFMELSALFVTVLPYL